jgi:hypothetical protein
VLVQAGVLRAARSTLSLHIDTKGDELTPADGANTSLWIFGVC